MRSLVDFFRSVDSKEQKIPKAQPRQSLSPAVRREARARTILSFKQAIGSLEMLRCLKSGEEKP